MQRWFRFSGAIALVSLFTSGIPLTSTSHAQEKPAEASAESTEATADADTALEGFDPHDLPTPGKHQLRPTPLQIANHRIKRLNERLVTQNNRIAHLEGVVGKKDEQISTLEEKIKALGELQTKSDARLEAMFSQIATVSRQVEGLESLQGDHARRTARAAQQQNLGSHPARRSATPEGQPQVVVPGGQPGAAAGGSIPRAIPVHPAAATPAPTPEKVVLPPPEGSVVYEVKPGDNLTKIARAYGTSVAEILKFNKITDERKLQIGQELNIPPSDTPAPTPTAPAAATPEAAAPQP